MFSTKYIIVISFISMLLQNAYALTLVESFPADTKLDHPDIANTKDVWIEMFDGAKKTIDIAEFYISNKEGEVLEEVIASLKKAAVRGVKIRFVVDKSMLNESQSAIDELKGVKNINLRIINLGDLTGGILHAKYFIVDKKSAFVGSQNFDWRALRHIYELGLKIDDKNLVDSISKIFEIDWTLANGKNKIKKLRNRIRVDSISKDKKSRVVASPPLLLPSGIISSETALVDLINRAKKSVNVQVMTYSPTNYEKTRYYGTIDNAIRGAALRGVNVKMVIADWSTGHPKIDYLKSLEILPNIEIKISSIPPYSDTFIPYARVDHCKYVIADGDTMWIGTSNIDEDYFKDSRNIEIVTREKKIVDRVSKIFDERFDGLYTEKLDINKEYTPPKRSE